MSNTEKMRNNIVCMAGRLVEPLKFSHSNHGEDFYQTKLSIQRNSGIFDEIPLIISERLLMQTPVCIYDYISIYGEFRSWSNSKKLQLFLWPRSLTILNEYINHNKIFLEGYICKEPVYRITPLGRKITDVILAVNREYKKSDYIPLIFWGRSAFYVGTLDVGDKIKIKGRIQSREYVKLNENATYITKTAYEVSSTYVEKISNN